jgi:hypothetical protein
MLQALSDSVRAAATTGARHKTSSAMDALEMEIARLKVELTETRLDNGRLQVLIEQVVVVVLK